MIPFSHSHDSSFEPKWKEWCSSQKARMFVELWCHEVGEKLNLRPPVSGELINKIKQISNCNKIPGYIVDSLNILRREGNNSSFGIQTLQ